MEVFSLESSTETEVLVIRYSKENQPRLTKRWSTESNLAKRCGKEDIRTRTRNETMSCDSYFIKERDFMKERRTQLTENAKNLSEEEMNLLEIDIFKPLDFYEILFNRMKRNDKRTYTKNPAFDGVFVIRF